MICLPMLEGGGGITLVVDMAEDITVVDLAMVVDIGGAVLDMAVVLCPGTVYMLSTGEKPDN